MPSASLDFEITGTEVWVNKIFELVFSVIGLFIVITGLSLQDGSFSRVVAFLSLGLAVFGLGSGFGSLATIQVEHREIEDKVDRVLEEVSQ